MQAFDEPSPPLDWEVGVDVGGTKMRIEAHPRSGVAKTAVAPKTWTIPTGAAASITPEALTGHLRRCFRELNDEGGSGKVIAGIALPGLVDECGTLQDCDVLPGLSGWHPSAAADLGGNVTVQAVLNDGEAALTAYAAAIAPFDAAKTALAVVGCGTGIAMAVQLGGVRLRQLRPMAGELGMSPFLLQPEAAQGHSPWLNFDAVASGAALVRRCGFTTGQELALAASSGSAIPAEIAANINEAGAAFGAALSTIVHVLHPHRIGLYGGTLSLPGYWQAALRALDQLAHPLLRKSCIVEMIPDPDYAVARGARIAAVTAARSGGPAN